MPAQNSAGMLRVLPDGKDYISILNLNILDFFTQKSDVSSAYIFVCFYGLPFKVKTMKVEHFVILAQNVRLLSQNV